MKKFRRSKNDSQSGKPSSISIPQKDAIAIVPPKKVIKALYNYTVPNPEANPGYLSFTEGDFLHVVGRETDPDWYEACNPLVGTRGLVPVRYFEPVGKTVRDSNGSTTSGASQLIAGHDSGYAESKNGSRDSVGAQGPSSELPRSGRLSKGTGAMVYGIVQYDFKAERPDELEATEGEAIIVIAQSNPEWFVAKPITRLGGPGLIPVSFIEIRDMSTGKAVTDPQEAVQRAGVPKVEEWKKLAADYKNSSIPLGRLDAGLVGSSGIQQAMQNMSLSNGNQGPEQNGTGPPGSARTGPGPMPSGYSQPRSQQQLQCCVRASVPRYCYADDNFWFVVDAYHEDGSHWELSRFYTDFYDLQINLIQEFPVEAGTVKGSVRTLPYMPGPVTYVTDTISSGRRQSLDTYLKDLFRLGPHITNCYLVRRFFQPRDGDYEIDPDAQQSPNGYRLSNASPASSSPNPAASASHQSSNANPNGVSYGQGSPYHHQRNQSSLGTPMLRQNSALPQGSAGSGGPAATSHKIKVFFDQTNCVVLRMPPNFRYTDLYAKLQERRKMERRATRAETGAVDDDDDEGELVIDYRDEQDGQYYRLDGDEDLKIAMERNPKLTLNVGMLGT